MIFTVFTPTFNRRQTLHRVFDALCAQTLSSKEFEWLIVDDGSTDGTAALIAEWSLRAPFEIRYTWQENGGKHRAWNRGVDGARGELFAFLDSDDACTNDALEKIAQLWRAIDSKEHASLAGILTRCQYPDGRPFGPRLPRVARSDFAELVLVHGLRSETWMAVRTEVLREHRFPAGPRGKLVPEGTLWHRIARHYPWVLLDEPLRIYYTGSFGSADQLSHPRPLRDQAPGLTLAYRSLLDNSWRHFGDSPFTFVRAALNLSRFSMYGGLALEPLQSLERLGARMLYATMLPLGASAFVVDKLLGRG